MLPYLTNPNEPDIRQVNFTQTQSNIHLNNQAPPPCVVELTSPPTCVQIFPQQQLCEFEGGTWYGPGGTQQFSDCCAVKNSHIYDQLTILPDSEAATRNANYKLLRKTEPNCTTTPPAKAPLPSSTRLTRNRSLRGSTTPTWRYARTTSVGSKRVPVASTSSKRTTSIRCSAS